MGAGRSLVRRDSREAQRAAGLCGRCGRGAQQWGDVLCAPCAQSVAAWLLWRRRAAVASRWTGACLVEGLVGAAAGALALWPATVWGWPAGAGLLAIAGLLAWLLATAVFLAGCWLLRPLLAMWGLWAAIDGAELILSWSLVVGVSLVAGYVPGMLAVVGALTGGLAAIGQGRAIARQTPRWAWWSLGSALLWGVAGAAAFAVELGLAGAPAGVVAGAGLGRLIHGLMAGPLLAWALGGRMKDKG